MFWVINRIFYILFRFQISQFLRVYSFWMQFFVLAVFSNSQKLSFYFFTYMQLLFSLTPGFKFGHIFSIIIVGFSIIFMIMFFFLIQYLYGKLSKYLLINMYRVDYVIFYHFLRFSVRPFIDSALHIFLFYKP